MLDKTNSKIWKRNQPHRAVLHNNKHDNSPRKCDNLRRMHIISKDVRSAIIVLIDKSFLLLEDFKNILSVFNGRREKLNSNTINQIDVFVIYAIFQPVQKENSHCIQAKIEYLPRQATFGDLKWTLTNYVVKSYKICSQYPKKLTRKWGWKRKISCFKLNKHFEIAHNSNKNSESSGKNAVLSIFVTDSENIE